MYKFQQGFTLFELMFAILIIGVLSSIALPIYLNYIAKSQFMAALADISSGKMLMDINLNIDTAISNDADGLSTIGLHSQTKNCSLIEAVGFAGAGLGNATIRCTIDGSSAINGKYISLQRNGSSGLWTCQTNVDNAYSDKCSDGNNVALATN